MNHDDSSQDELAGQFPNEVIRASAGTGKTFELSNRYLRLLAAGVESNSILATTFTRKGAGEILDRIIRRLSAAALDEAAATELTEQLRWTLPSARAADVLLELLKNLHRLEIGTLDSFFNRFAKAFSLELGLPATWEIVEQQQIERLQDSAIQSILGNKEVIGLLNLMSHGESKRRIATEIRDTVGSLYEVFSETTPESWERIARPSGLMDDQTLAAFIEALPDVPIPENNKPWAKAWAKLADDLKNKRYQDVVKAGVVGAVIAGKPTYQRKEISDAVRTVAETIRDHCAADLVNGLILRNTATRDLLQLFAAEFEPKKSSTGQLRFQDVTARLAQFIASISAEGMAFRLDNQVRHLLLDEFQDTSPAQWTVMTPFARRVTDTNDAAHSFFCVGDVKQAIFGWRGGAAEIFDRVEDELSNLADTSPRTKSYRSSPHVIDFVNHVFHGLHRFEPASKSSPDRAMNAMLAVHKWQDWFNEHETARQDLDGCATVEIAQPVTGEDGKLDAKESLFEATVAKVIQLHEQLPSKKTIGVLVRKNSEIGEIIFRLRQQKIEASEEGGNPLTDSAAVEIVLAALTLADAPGDSLARFRVSHSPLGPHYNLDPQTDQNGAECRQQGIAASKTLRHQLVTDGYGATLESMARTLAPACTARERTRLQQLVQIAYASESGRDVWQLRPSRFVNFIRDEYRAVEPSAARIRVMTVHRAKGLEFDAVVVPVRSSRHDQLVGQPPKVITGRDKPTDPIEVITRHVGKEIQSLLPQPIQQLFSDRDAQVIRESMCLLYVALTRAVHATHVILGPDVKLKSTTAAAVILSTVCEVDPDPDDGLVVHAAGNQNWFQTDPRPDEAPTALTKLDADLSKFYLPATSEPRPVTLLPTVTSGRGVPNRYPSETAPVAGATFGDRLMAPQNRRAANVGSLLHACFEQIAWLDEGEQPTDEALLDRLQRLEPDTKFSQHVIGLFRQVVKKPQVKALLSKTAYAKNHSSAADDFAVRNEYRFAITTDTGLLNGSVDRLVLHLKNSQVVGAQIIDFKSDRIKATDTPKRAEKYRGQMDAYREAICSTFAITETDVAQTIVFTEIGKVQSLDAKAISTNVPSPKKSKPKPNPPASDNPQQTLW